MRKLLMILAFFFVVLSVIFVVLPMDTMALLPTGLAVIFAVLTFIKSDTTQKKLPKWLLVISIALLLAAGGKALFVKDKVEADQDFQQEQVESTEDAQEELEELEELGDSI